MQLCRSETLQGKIRIEDKTHWSKVDSYILVCKCVLHVLLIVVPAKHRVYRIASLDVDNEKDIDWKSLNDPLWNWSTCSLWQRWRGLKVSIDNDGMSHHGEYMHMHCTFISLAFL
jgi:hypothetical protein